METLFQYSNKLISEVSVEFVRHAYNSINWNNRMLGVIGPRGVGKTTLLLQYIKNNLSLKETLYVTAEDFYFANNRLIDVASEFVKWGGKHLFIDEIHKYPDWSKELKLLYDYHPDLKIVFSGSSVLDIKKGSADLSRRAVMFYMQGLSFREYLAFAYQLRIRPYTLEEILANKLQLKEIPHPLPLFQEYLKKGYYPFAAEEGFQIKLMQVVNQTLEVDIPSFANMNVSTGRKLKQLMAIVAESIPFKPNMSKIAELLSISRNNVGDYFLYMEEAGMIMQARNPTEGIRALGKVEKIYLENPNLVFSLANQHQDKGNLRETFFMNQLKLTHAITSSPIADFRVDGIDFEIGRKNKSGKQLSQAKNGYLVKDDIETGYLNTIPLWNFGFLY
ncbi:ATP-binding protein [Mongoliitalea daihaiensis]|uniref:ATP-binding protein n=1 Tax=Mongoliitalea daihaiensis TaxID=2782006 RepID=UPI001F23499F|nr:AAA family ATPase [Mongoliitalea daihaiensis]UJP65837.1 AAA family ATPase [Mongoliitalea daihaiensis]